MANHQVRATASNLQLPLLGRGLTPITLPGSTMRRACRPEEGLHTSRPESDPGHHLSPLHRTWRNRHLKLSCQSRSPREKKFRSSHTLRVTGTQLQKQLPCDEARGFPSSCRDWIKAAQAVGPQHMVTLKWRAAECPIMEAQQPAACEAHEPFRRKMNVTLSDLLSWRPIFPQKDNLYNSKRQTVFYSPKRKCSVKYNDASHAETLISVAAFSVSLLTTRLLVSIHF